MDLDLAVNPDRGALDQMADPFAHLIQRGPAACLGVAPPKHGDASHRRRI